MTITTNKVHMKKYIVPLLVLCLLPLLISAMDPSYSNSSSLSSEVEEKISIDTLRQWFKPLMDNQQRMKHLAKILYLRERLTEAYLAEKVAAKSNQDAPAWDLIIQELFDAESQVFDEADDMTKALVLGSDSALEAAGSGFTFKDFSLLMIARKELCDGYKAYGLGLNLLKNYLASVQRIITYQTEYLGVDAEIKEFITNLQTKVVKFDFLVDSSFMANTQFLDCTIFKEKTIRALKNDFRSIEQAAPDHTQLIQHIVLPHILMNKPITNIGESIILLNKVLDAVFSAGKRFFALLDTMEETKHVLYKYATDIYERATLFKTSYAFWYHQVYGKSASSDVTIDYSQLPEKLFVLHELLSNSTNKDYSYALAALENNLEASDVVSSYSATIQETNPEAQELLAEQARAERNVQEIIRIERLRHQKLSKRNGIKSDIKKQAVKKNKILEFCKARRNLSDTITKQSPLIKKLFLDLGLWINRKNDIVYSIDQHEPYFDWLGSDWLLVCPSLALRPVLEYYITLLKSHQSSTSSDEPEKSINKPISIPKSQNKHKKNKKKGKVRELMPNTTSPLPEESSSSTSIDVKPAVIEQKLKTEIQETTPLPVVEYKPEQVNTSKLKKLADTIRSTLLTSVLINSEIMLHNSNEYIAIRQYRDKSPSEAMVLILYPDNKAHNQIIMSSAVKLSFECNQKKIQANQENGAWDKFHDFSKTIDQYLTTSYVIDNKNQNSDDNKSLMADINLNQLANNYYARIIPGKIMSKFYDHTRAIDDRTVYRLGTFSGAFVYIFDKTTGECIHRCFHESNSSNNIKLEKQSLSIIRSY
jgi:hypothetical protein